MHASAAWQRPTSRARTDCDERGNPPHHHHRRGNLIGGRLSTRRPGAAAIAVIRNLMRHVCRGSVGVERTGEALGDICPGVRWLLRHCRRSGRELGKAVAVGADGELEIRAILHPTPAPLPRRIGQGRCAHSSSKKRGGPGVPLDIPLRPLMRQGAQPFRRSRSVPDAPRADEIVVAIAVTDPGRPHPRVGGLTRTRLSGHGVS